MWHNGQLNEPLTHVFDHSRVLRVPSRHVGRQIHFQQVRLCRARI
jgi:hypothetical protein